MQAKPIFVSRGKHRIIFALAYSTLLAIVNPSYAQTIFTKVTTGPIGNSQNGACSWVDIDNDGYLDLFASNKGGANSLYHNEGNGVFVQVLDGTIVNAGLGSHATSWADVDNDGRIDLLLGYTSSVGSPPVNQPSLLFRQEPDGTFTQTTLGRPTALGAAWADYDNDGWLDLVVAYGSQNVLWHNNGAGGLSAVTGAGIDVSGDSISWADYDNDGDMDLLVTEGPPAVSGGGNSRLYRNDGNGVFTRITTGQLAQRSTNVMAAAWGDYDNDGFLDLYLPRGDFAGGVPSFLFHNNTNGTFTQVQQSPFTNDVGFAVSASWADYDNDGWLDLFVTEGSGSRNRLYHNNGDGTFTRVLDGPIATDPGYCVGNTWGDYDRDGFLDLFVSTDVGAGGPTLTSYLYHNEGNSNTWITIKCAGTVSNRSAIGTKVRVKATISSKTFWQLREINTGDGWAGVPLEAHFGLGSSTNIETLRIEWPSGTVQEFQNVPARQYLTVTEPSRLIPGPSNGTPRFTLRGGRNMTYDIETSTNLADWSLLDTLTLTNLNGTGLVTDTNAPASDGRFYRAVLR